MAHESPLLTQEQLDRYARQIRLAAIGLRGQARLLQSKVAMLGGVAGMMGTMQALEAASGTFRTFRRHRRAACPVCGDAPSPTAPIDGGLLDLESHGYALERGEEERGVYDDEDA